MVAITTDQNWPNAALTIMDSHVPPRPAVVDGVPVWASSDETVLKVTAAADGMSAVVDTVAPSPLDAAGAPVPNRITVTADADVGAGVVTITGVSEDITVTLGTAHQASTMTLALGTATDKP